MPERRGGPSYPPGGEVAHTRISDLPPVARGLAENLLAQIKEIRDRYGIASLKIATDEELKRIPPVEARRLFELEKRLTVIGRERAVPKQVEVAQALDDVREAIATLERVIMQLYNQPIEEGAEALKMIARSGQSNVAYAMCVGVFPERLPRTDRPEQEEVRVAVEVLGEILKNADYSLFPVNPYREFSAWINVRLDARYKTFIDEARLDVAYHLAAAGHVDKAIETAKGLESDLVFIMLSADFTKLSPQQREQIFKKCEMRVRINTEPLFQARYKIKLANAKWQLGLPGARELLNEAKQILPRTTTNSALALTAELVDAYEKIGDESAASSLLRQIDHALLWHHTAVRKASRLLAEGKIEMALKMEEDSPWIMHDPALARKFAAWYIEHDQPEKADIRQFAFDLGKAERYISEYHLPVAVMFARKGWNWRPFIEKARQLISNFDPTVPRAGQKMAGLTAMVDGALAAIAFIQMQRAKSVLSDSQSKVPESAKRQFDRLVHDFADKYDISPVGSLVE
jgi:hypothetical protein